MGQHPEPCITYAQNPPPSPVAPPSKPPTPGTSPLCESDAQWEELFKKLDKQIAGYEKFRGKLGDGAKTLAACLKFDHDFDRLGERVGGYAHLKVTEDQANSTYQAMVARFQNLATRASQAASYIRPEILALPKKTLDQYLAAKELQPFRLVLERIIRFKPYTLPRARKRSSPCRARWPSAASKAFRQLLDADLKFGLVKNEKGQQVELSNATFSKLLVSPERSVRKTAFHQYYEQFTGAREHAGRDARPARFTRTSITPRSAASRASLEAALFPDNVPQSVYDNLIAAVRKHLPAVHRYYDVRRRKMKLTRHSPLRHLRADPQRPGDQAHLEAGGGAGDRCARAAGQRVLRGAGEGPDDGRWCDRYPNQGKQQRGVFQRHRTTARRTS